MNSGDMACSKQQLQTHNILIANQNLAPIAAERQGNRQIFGTQPRHVPQDKVESLGQVSKPSGGAATDLRCWQGFVAANPKAL